MSVHTRDEKHVLSMANENYLKSIYRLSLAGDPSEGVRSVDIADQLDVSKASVNKAILTLKEAGFVEQTPYGRIILTEGGKSYASQVWLAYSVLHAFLTKQLGVSPEIADQEACFMEHALSNDTLMKWNSYLDSIGTSIDDN
ncbi:MAG: metal-dependent transcriptional regulator [Atopobiaceae bacterium]|nr:metal-dependent transcriptional regulator [Atopobiaceae bacterium]